MSLVSTWVLADDGMYYKEPVLGGITNNIRWSIYFDDDDPPEMVVQSIIKPIKSIIGNILKENNLDYKISDVFQGNRNSYRNFFDKETNKYKMKRASSCFLKITKPIPVKLIIKHYEKRDRPKGQCVIYTFGNPCPEID